MLHVMLLVAVFVAAAVVYLHVFVWPTMTATVAADNERVVHEFADLVRDITWWFRARALVARVRAEPLTTVDIGAWRVDMPDMACRLRGCQIVSPTHMRWHDVDIRFFEVTGAYLTLDAHKIFPAEHMLPIDATTHLPHNATTLAHVMPAPATGVHETLRAMYRVAVATSKKADDEVPAPPVRH